MKDMKIVFALVVISVMAIGLGSANATVLFETDFESYTGGSATVIGQDSWAGWESPYAVVGESGIEGQFMPGYKYLYVQAVGRNANAVYRPFDAQTGLVHFEVFYMPYQSNTSWRSVSLRDSSADNADFAAMIGTSKNYDTGWK